MADKPKRERGLFVPSKVLKLFQDGVISAREAVLLSLVESKQFNGKRGRCVTTTKEIRECFGVTEEAVRKMLHRLTAAKYLKVRKKEKGDGWGWKLRISRKAEPRSSDGVLIPDGVLSLLRAGTVKPNHAFVLAYICSFVRNERECFAGDAAIGRFAGLHPRVARAALADLRTANLITVEGRGKTRRLKSNITPVRF